MCNCDVKYTVGNNTLGHCAQCHQTFMGERAFDRHQMHDRADGRPTCIDPAADPREKPGKWWMDDRGRWHEGPRMTEAQREALRVRAEAEKTARVA